jgi:hypothetical protein
MRDLAFSFQSHQGTRGVHLYTDRECKFLTWQEIVSFINKLPKESDPTFGEKLLDTLSNYNPDTEFLALHQDPDNLSIELFTPPVG